MSETTDRLVLPLIASGQAQKEMTHNEALAMLDIAVQPVVEAAGVNAPPADPAAGACWIVGDAPLGAWAGQARAIAGWTASGWRFVTPREGWTAWVTAHGTSAQFDGSDWREGVIAAATIEIGGIQVVAAQQAGVAVPTGGAVIDSEARAALAGLISRLQEHGLIAA